MTISFRRNLLPRIFTATIVLVGVLFSHLLKATPQPQLLGNAWKAYRLQPYHTHTKERLDIVYRVAVPTYRELRTNLTISFAIIAPAMSTCWTQGCLTCCMT
jgi:hypothetical protein